MRSLIIDNKLLFIYNIYVRYSFMDNLKDIIAANLKALRINKDMRQLELAEALGVTQAAVARYEAGITTPNEEVLLKYADLFDVSLDQIFGRSIRYQNSNFEPISADLKREFDNLLADSLKPGSKSRKAIEEIVKNNK